VKRALEVAGLLALLALGWLATELAWTTHVTRPKVLVTLENVDRVAIVAGVTASEVQKGALEWQKASKAQSSATTKALSHVDAVAAQFSSFVSATDKSLNSGLIPQLQAIAQEQNSALLSNQARVGANLDTLQNELESLRRTTDAATAQISDPSIKTSLANVAAASEQMAGVASDAHTESGLIVAQTREAFKPKNKVLAVLQLIGGGTVTAAELFYYLTH